MRINIPAHPDQGRVILAARQAAGLKTVELAEAISCSPRYVRYLQRGQRCPSEETAGRLQEALAVKIPLPKIDPLLTASGRRLARQRERERQQAAEAERQQQEAQRRGQQLMRAVAPRFTFGSFRAGRRG